MPKAVIGTGNQFKRNELRNVEAMYDQIDDCLLGSIAVKARHTKYLPAPNPGDMSDENKARYVAYKARAVFYNVTRRTLEGLLGELFDIDPAIEVPPAMEDLVEDVTGEGIGLTQFAKIVARHVLSKGRSGIFTDYPATGGEATTEETKKTIRPILRSYHPRQIINWRYKRVGALKKISLVILEEEYDKPTSDFSLVKGKQWRILQLNDANQYTVTLYRDSSTQPVFEDGTPGGVITPLDATGTPFDTIPFSFVGSENNNGTVDYPPMFDISDLNIAHYRNSADYEEAVYLCGQPTTVIIGLTEDWANKYYKDGVGLGSRAALPLPVGADAKLLEVTETNMGKDAMESKEKQMVALGAKLVEQATVQRTATEASMEVASDMSILASTSQNVSVAIEWALGWAAQYTGDPSDKINFKLNQEFSIAFSDPTSRDEVIKAWVSEAISFTEMRTALKKGGMVTQTDDVARKEILKDRGEGNGPTVPGSLGFDENGKPIPLPNPADNTPGGTTSTEE